MKHLSLTLLLAIMTPAIFAQQDWRIMIQNPDMDFEEVRSAFYNEFGELPGARGSGWKQFKRWEYFLEPRLDNHGKKPDPRTLYEELQRARLQQQYRGGAGDWQLLGPIDEPQNGNGVSIGRVSAIAFHPLDTNVIWAGAPSGGAWRSEDNGISWTPMTDNLPNIGVSEIVFNPNNPDTIYMATGDGSSSDTYSFGVMMTTDGGQTWDTTGLSFSMNQSRNIRRMIIDPNNPNILLVATNGGIFRTADAGITWFNVKSGNFADLEFKPNNSDTVYASTSSGSTPFFVSYNNGQSWTVSTTGMNTNAMQRVKIDISAAAPNVVYALASGSDQGMEGLYRSNNSGATWNLVASTPNLLGYSEFGTDEGGQGWYSMELAVSPLDENIVRVGGINIWKSTNGGNTFNIEAHWTADNGVYVHADQHRAVYHPTTGQFYAGCDGGLYRRSHFFNGYESISSGMSITQFYRLACAYTDPTIVMSGAQDNGTMLWKNNIWKEVFGGDGMEAMIDPQDDNIMFCTTQGGNLYKSSDGGFNFSDNLSPAEGAWVTPFMLQPGNAEVVYAAAGPRVYRSDAGGSDWWEFSPTLITLSSGPLTMLDVATSNTEYVVAGSPRTIYISKDLGGTWDNILGGLPGPQMSYVAFDPLNENTLWVTFSGYSNGQKVYRSTDAGETWTNMSMNLPNLPANCVEIERSTIGGVYVGTDVGVYYWDESLTEWEPYMTGLPNVIVNEMEIHEPSQTIRAATYGRGVWESPTRNFLNVGIETPTERSRDLVSIWPNPTTETVNIQFNGNVEAQPMHVMDAVGRKVIQNLNSNLDNSVSVGIQPLQNGVYYIVNDEGLMLGRFIVNKN